MRKIEHVRTLVQRGSPCQKTRVEPLQFFDRLVQQFGNEPQVTEDDVLIPVAGILDILDKVSHLEGLEPDNRNLEEVAIHANEIRNYFFDETKHLNEVIPPVLLVRMDFKKFEVAPRQMVEFKNSKRLKDDSVMTEASVQNTSKGQPTKSAEEKPEATEAE